MPGRKLPRHSLQAEAARNVIQGFSDACRLWFLSRRIRFSFRRWKMGSGCFLYDIDSGKEMGGQFARFSLFIPLEDFDAPTRLVEQDHANDQVRHPGRRRQQVLLSLLGSLLDLIFWPLDFFFYGIPMTL